MLTLTYIKSVLVLYISTPVVVLLCALFARRSVDCMYKCGMRTRRYIYILIHRWTKTQTTEIEAKKRRCSLQFLPFWNGAVVLVCWFHLSASIRCFLLLWLLLLLLLLCLYSHKLNDTYSRLFSQCLNQLAHVTTHNQSDFLSFRWILHHIFFLQYFHFF